MICVPKRKTLDKLEKVFILYTIQIIESKNRNIKEFKMTVKENVAYLAVCLEEAQKVATKLGISNLFYNERYVEVLAASLLGHDYNTEVRGPDAFDEYTNPVEYKSINKATTKNGSFQFHWLTRDKVKSYSETKDIYFIIRQDVNINQVWQLPMSIILPDLVQKYQEAEKRRHILNIAGAAKLKNTDAHKSYSLSTLQRLGAVLVYDNTTKVMYADGV